MHTIRVENSLTPFNAFLRIAVAQQAYPECRTTSNGNDWLGCQVPKQWFLFLCPASKMEMAANQLQELVKIKAITSWDFGHNRGVGRLESCDHCGTMKINCSTPGSVPWHRSHEHSKCPRRKTCSEAARSGIWWAGRVSDMSSTLKSHLNDAAAPHPDGKYQAPPRDPTSRTPSKRTAFSQCLGILQNDERCANNSTNSQGPAGYCGRHRAQAAGAQSPSPASTSAQDSKSTPSDLPPAATPMSSPTGFGTLPNAPADLKNNSPHAAPSSPADSLHSLSSLMTVRDYELDSDASMDSTTAPPSPPPLRSSHVSGRKRRNAAASMRQPAALG